MTDFIIAAKYANEGTLPLLSTEVKANELFHPSGICWKNFKFSVNVVKAADENFFPPPGRIIPIEMSFFNNNGLGVLSFFFFASQNLQNAWSAGW